MVERQNKKDTSQDADGASKTELTRIIAQVESVHDIVEDHEK